MNSSQPSVRDEGVLQRHRTCTSGGSRGPSPTLIFLAAASLLLLASTAGLPIPRYNMAWGEFSHRLSLDPAPPLILGPARLFVIVGAGFLVLLMVLRSLLLLGRTLGRGFAIFATLVFTASLSTLIPLPRLGVTDGATYLYAIRFISVSLLVIGGGIALGQACPSALARRARLLLDRIGAPRCMFAACGIMTLALLGVSALRLDAIPHAMDEVMQVFQAKIFASGHLWITPPSSTDLISHFGLIHDGGKWRCMWPPGNALAMAPFVAAGALWLYPPILSSLTLAAIFVFVSRTDDRNTALLAVLLLVTSPWFWSMGSSYMSHVPSALWLSAFLMCLVRAREGNLPACAAAGLCLGAAAATREADALFLSAPFGVLWALDVLDSNKRRDWLRRSAAMALGLVPGLGFLLGTNWLENGAPFVFGHEIVFKGRYGFGLGAQSPGIRMDPFAAPVHTFLAGWLNLRGLLTDLQVVLFGLGIPSLALPAFALIGQSRDRMVLTGMAAIVLFLGMYLFFPLDMTMFGPRYAYGALPLFAWLGARGLSAVHRRALAAGSRRALGGMLAVGILIAWGHAIPGALASFHPSFAGVDRSLERALETRGIDRAIVWVLRDPRDLRGNPFLYTSAFRLADPDLSGIIPVHEGEATSSDAALLLFPDRPVYAWLAVYEGTFVRPRLIASILVRLHRPGEPGYQRDHETSLLRALQAAQASLAGGVGRSELWNALGALAGIGEDPRAARSFFGRAIALAPGDPNPWINLALLERVAGNLEPARAAARSARRLGAPLPPPLLSLLPDTPGPPANGGP